MTRRVRDPDTCHAQPLQTFHTTICTAQAVARIARGYALRRGPGRGHCQPPAARYAGIAVAVATGIIPWPPACIGIAVMLATVCSGLGVSVSVYTGWLPPHPIDYRAYSLRA